MSTLDKNQVWSDVSKESLSSKYEKCRNITEEIYKRINITFQIKKLENAGQSDISDHSDLIDSNDLSNETDLFACDKSDSIPSSEEKTECVNINNNVEPRVKSKPPVYKRPRKRFRKRVKKRQSKTAPMSDSDGSSDEAPLSRIVDTQCVADSPESVMGVPSVIIITKEIKPKTQPEKKTKKGVESRNLSKGDQKAGSAKSLDPSVTLKEKVDKPATATKIDSEKSLKIVIDKEEVEKMIIDVRLEAKRNAIDNQMEIKRDTDKLVDNTIDNMSEEKEKSVVETKICSICSLSFRGERGLRRHIAMSHIISEDVKGRPEREVKPA